MARALARRMARRTATRSQRWGLGLETRLALPLFALLLLVVIWSATLHFLGVERDTARRAAADSVRELIDTYEAQIVRNLGAIDQTMKVIQYALGRGAASATLLTLEQQGLLPSGLVFTVNITDRAGRVKASNPATSAASVAGSAYFAYHQRHDNELALVSQSPRQNAPGEWDLSFTRRLNDAAGRFAGLVIVSVDPEYFTSGYERARLGEQGMLGLYGADGTMRALRVGDKVSWTRTPLTPAILANAPAPGEWSQVRRYTSVRQLHGYALGAVVGLAEDEQMAAFDAHRRNILWEVGLGSALLMLMLAWQGTRTQRSVRRAQETYAAASEANMDAFFVLHSVRDEHDAILDFKISAANTRAEQMTGFSKHDLQGQTLCGLLPRSRRDGLLDQLAHAATVGGVHEQEWEYRLPNRQSRWLHRQVVGVEGGIVAIVRDISERKRDEARILHMAHHDPLTALPNRSLLGKRLEEAIVGADRQGGTVLVAFIDLDGFKLVNDGLGHASGDELLKSIATRMLGKLRRQDTASRFGGDEFVLVLPQQQDDAHSGQQVLDSIRAAIGEPVMLGDNKVKVNCSVGIAIYPTDGANAATLLANADAAMYRAKKTGKNNFKFYSVEMNAKAADDMALLGGLRNALDEGQFRLVYQPKVDLRSGRIFGVEALLRWRHPVRGDISPVRFIPLAEDSGLVVALGQWVLETACLQNRAWQRLGLAPISMAVNVSPRQFDDMRLVDCVAQALADSGLAPAELELEVTESLIMHDLQQALEKMSELKAMGLALSIDDFGTGYSSLSALKSFPISRLKIDQSFVRDLATSADDQAIARAIIALAHQLQLRVIAEGVETEAQCRFLQDNGCDEIQGYLFSPPVSPEEIQIMLEQQKHLLPLPPFAAAVPL